jgi:glyoxylase-like metal-dependent hydrolase (beta-lactamase superfamily II)
MTNISATFTLGDLQISQLSDGATFRDPKILFDDVDASEWTHALGLKSPDELIPFNFSSFLVESADSKLLIDTAYGHREPEPNTESCAELLVRMSEKGVQPEDIDFVVHSHLHFDHVGWNLDEKGNITFPNAMHIISEPEFDWWINYEGNDHPLKEKVQSKIQPLIDSNQIKTFVGDYKVNEFLTMVYAPGHTPGHTVQLLESGGESLIILGDSAHHPQHLIRQDWHPIFDWDRPQARASRKKIANLAIEKDSIVTGVHWPVLTLAKLSEKDGRYTLKFIDRD